MLLKLATIRAAWRGEHDMRCSSLNERDLLGRRAREQLRFVKSWR